MNAVGNTIAPSKLQFENKLRQASFDNQLEVVLQLLESGVDFNAAGAESQKTALHRAAQNRHLGIVTLLLSSGADPDLVDKNGQTAAQLIEAVDNNNSNSKLEFQQVFHKYKRNPRLEERLRTAAKYSHFKHLQDCLREGVNVNIQDPHSKTTAFHYAIESAHVSATLYLIQAGANPHIQDVNNRNCIHLTKRFQHKLFSYLIGCASVLHPATRQLKLEFIQSLIQEQKESVLPANNESEMFYLQGLFGDTDPNYFAKELLQPISPDYFAQLQQIAAKRNSVPLNSVLKEEIHYLTHSLLMEVPVSNMRRITCIRQICQFSFTCLFFKCWARKQICHWKRRELETRTLDSQLTTQERIQSVKQQSEQYLKELDSSIVSLQKDVKKLSSRVLSKSMNPFQSEFMKEYIEQYFEDDSIKYLIPTRDGNVEAAAESAEYFCIERMEKFAEQCSFQFAQHLARKRKPMERSIEFAQPSNMNTKELDALFELARSNFSDLIKSNLSSARNSTQLAIQESQFTFYLSITHGSKFLLKLLDDRDAKVIRESLLAQQEQFQRQVEQQREFNLNAIQSKNLSTFELVKLKERQYSKKFEESKRTLAEEARENQELLEIRARHEAEQAATLEKQKLEFQRQIIDRANESKSSLVVLKDIIANENNVISERDFLGLVSCIFSDNSASTVNNKLTLKLGEFGTCGTHFRHDRDRAELLDPNFVCEFRRMLANVSINKQSFDELMKKSTLGTEKWK